MVISPKTIQQVMDTARIEEVVGDFVALKKRGASLLGLCPFHNEKTPSFNVSPARGIFKCFGCGQAGNAVGFIMEHEKFSYPDAIRYLAKRYHIDVIEEGSNDEIRQEVMDRESMFLLNQFAAEYFADQLWHTENGQAIALSYFRERGFTDETIRKFQLGFHPEGRSEFTEAALKAGYNKAFMVRSGLTIEREDGGTFDRFRGRVMFPIHQVSGKVTGFGGRILTSDKKIAKYLNSPESDVYHKSQVLYGINLARKAIVTKDECLLVEGYTDVISLHQTGIENVVSSSGTSLTADQIRIIQRYTKNITFLFDGDAAGLKAAFRGIDMVLEQGMQIRIVQFPDGEDPDSFARNNPPVYVQDFIRDQAVDFINFKASVLLKDAGGDPIRKAEVIRDIIQSLSLVPDPIIRSVYVRECSRLLELPEQTLIGELNRLVKNRRQKADEQIVRQDERTAPPEIPESDAPAPETGYLAEAQEADIVRILIKYANREFVFHGRNEQGEAIDVQVRTGDFILHELITDNLEPVKPAYHRIFDIIIESGEAAFPEESWYLQHSDPEISVTAINLTSVQHTLSEHWREIHGIYVSAEEEMLRKTVMEAVYAFKLRRVQVMLNELRQQIGTAKPDDDISEALEQYVSLENAKRELAGQLSYVIL
jgi:DNA primase